MSDTQADIELVERGYAAFDAKDMATMRGLLAPEMTWHVPGHSALSGAKRGADATLAHFGAMAEGSAGTVRAELQHCLADGHGHVVALGKITAQSEDAQMDIREAILFTICDGRAIEAIQTLDDIDAFDRYWASALTPAAT